MTRPSFLFFQSHLDLAHSYWQRLLKKGSAVIDATCGNGHDSLILAKTALTETEGFLYCIDLQKEAIETTKNRLKEGLSPASFQRISFFQQSHEVFPSEIPPCDLIVYNLGYLPGTDHSITTHGPSTLYSLENALSLLNNGGVISITCYPGHEAGFLEKKALLDYSASLSPQEYLVCHHQIENRRLAPSLLLIFKKLK